MLSKDAHLQKGQSVCTVTDIYVNKCKQYDGVNYSCLRKMT